MLSYFHRSGLVDVVVVVIGPDIGYVKPTRRIGHAPMGRQSGVSLY